MNKRFKLYVPAAAGLALLATTSAHAAIDTAAAKAAIEEAGGAAGVIGLAVLLVTIGVKVFKWMRSAA